MVVLLALIACGGLPQEGVAARSALEQALQARDPAAVSAAARASAPWRGEDPALDRLLGDALANVLMHPGEGLALLEANPAPESRDWQDALRGAALRTGDTQAMARAWAAAGRAAPDFRAPIIGQAVTRAIRDPKLTIPEIDAVVADCELLEQRPRIGRKGYSAPAPRTLLAAARALGATELAMGRTAYPTDPDPEGGQGLWSCADLRIIPGEALPVPFPTHVLVIGATDGVDAVFLELRLEDEVPWVFVSSNAEWAARWVRAANLLEEGGSSAVSAELGTGLAGLAFPNGAAGRRASAP